MKPIIIIEGNMASGKSMYAIALHKALKLPVYSMDKARREVFLHMNVSPNEAEHRAGQYLAGWILNKSSFIYERIGTGVRDANNDKVLKSRPTFRILIDVAPSRCVDQFENRKRLGTEKLMLPRFMNDYEGYIYSTHLKLKARKDCGKYNLVIDNVKNNNKPTFKAQITEAVQGFRALGKMEK